MGFNAAYLNRYNILYQDKPLMIQASIAFVVIFLHFLNDSSDFQISKNLVTKVGQPHRHEVIDNFKILKS